jgi:hypothetical protein
MRPYSVQIIVFASGHMCMTRVTHNGPSAVVAGGLEFAPPEGEQGALPDMRDCVSPRLPSC